MAEYFEQALRDNTDDVINFGIFKLQTKPVKERKITGRTLDNGKGQVNTFSDRIIPEHREICVKIQDNKKEV